ncbi:MAG: hypothetical protein RR144_05660, partial [Clostridia bacterium]
VCSSYVNTTYATSGRSIGATNQSIGNIGDSGIVYNANSNDVRLNDTYYQNDIDALNAAGIRFDVTTWLGSRVHALSSSWSNFNVRRVNSDGSVSSNIILYREYSGGGTDHYSYTYGVEAAVSLKTGIKVTGGEGTEASPYQIGI